MPRSTASNIALGKRLVDFFGGFVDYNDCDNSDSDYAVAEKTADECDPQDGQPWDDFQERMFNLKPITKEEIEACRQYSAYPDY